MLQTFPAVICPAASKTNNVKVNILRIVENSDSSVANIYRTLNVHVDASRATMR